MLTAFIIIQHVCSQEIKHPGVIYCNLLITPLCNDPSP
jgi:hypothetical protein